MNHAKLWLNSQEKNDKKDGLEFPIPQAGRVVHKSNYKANF